MKELYIDCGITQNRAALFKDGRLEDLYIENTDFNSINGNIYRGRIENLEEGLSAAFINIGIDKNALLHFDELSDLKQYKRGQELIVQVIREASGSKGPRVSTVLSIPGKYVVLLPADNYIGVSKKIDNHTLRKKIKDFFTELVEPNYGVIIRTEGGHIPLEELYDDYKDLKEKWKMLEHASEYRKAPAILFDSKSFYDYIVREYVKADVEKIYLNRPDDINLFKEKLNSSNKLIKDKVSCDEYNFTLQDKIEKEIHKAGERMISLPSGGYIVIDHTEAFTCIDVNSGTYTGQQDVEKTILSVNLEACIELERAVRLRKISGIILIDFIDMKLESSRASVIEALERAFYNDNSHFKIYGFTKLGILETTRAKTGIRLQDFVYSDIVQKVLNPAYCLKLIENQCIKYKKHYHKNNFEVDLEAAIYDVHLKIITEFIIRMRNIYKIEVQIMRATDVKGFSFIKKM